MFGDIVLGPKASGDFDEPLVGHVELQGVPRHVRARVNRPADGVAPDAIEFHGCKWNFAPAKPSCDQGEGDRIAQVDAWLRNTLVRPADLPSLVPTAPLYATALGRGNSFEVVTRLVDVAEVQIALRQDVVGLRTDVGGGVPLQILADFEDLDLNKYSDNESQLPIVDLDGAVLIDPLPPVLDVCFRAAGARGKKVNDFTAECQDDAPFGADVPINADPTWLAYHQSDGPLSVAYDASDSPGGIKPFDVTTDVTLVAHDVKIDPGGNDLLVDDLTVRGHLAIADLPETLVAHALVPDENGHGPTALRYTTGGTDEQVDVDFAAEMLEGDRVCEDPRGPLPGYGSLCVSGRLENLPSQADLRFNPDKAQDNLSVITSGEHAMNLRDLRLSAVRGLSENGETARRALIVFGDIEGLPSIVTGTVNLPSTMEFTTKPGKPLTSADLTVRNFVLPDDLPETAAARCHVRRPEPPAGPRRTRPLPRAAR